MVESIVAQHNARSNRSTSRLAARFPRLISYTTAALVFLLAMGAFVLSYNALWETALTYGVPARLAWIWPLLIDFALIVFSLAVVRANLHNERTAWPWLLVGIYTIATLSFNILHAPTNLTARVVAVVAPVSLFLSFETLMGMLKSEVNRAAAVASLADLAQQQEQIQAEINEADRRRTELAAEIEEADRRRAELAAKIEQLTARQQGDDSYPRPNNTILAQSPQEKDNLRHKANAARTSNAKDRRKKVRKLAQDNLTQVEMAERLDVSKSTIRRDLAAIRSEDILKLRRKGLDEETIADELELSLETVQSETAGLNGRVREAA